MWSGWASFLTKFSISFLMKRKSDAIELMDEFVRSDLEEL